VVEPGAAGLQARALRLIDDTPALALTLQGVAAQPLALDSGGAARAIDAALAAGIAGVCAELLGGMEAALRLTVDYLGTRQQFGRAIGDNQALRHALADMLVGVEMARSMAIVAAVQLDRCAEPDALADIHRAKLVVARHARALAESAVQLHGGIGMTEEYAVGNYLRRVLVLETCFGDADVHVHHIDASHGGTGRHAGILNATSRNRFRSIEFACTATLHRTRPQGDTPMTPRTFSRRAALATALATLAFGAAAQGDWPSKPITIVVPGPAGSGMDIYARMLAAPLQAALKTPFVVDNKAGANSIIGNAAVAKAPGDGYTFLFAPSSSIAINPIIQPKMPYDTLKDLQPVAQIGASGFLLVASTGSGLKTLQDMVNYARANPGKLIYGTWGNGSSGHLGW
jgi:hypothetical protein